MKNKNNTYPYPLVVFLISISVLLSFGFIGEDKTGKKKTTSKVYKSAGISQSGKHGDSYRLFINNINLPMNNAGVLADVNIPPNGTLGRYDGIGFLFSAGFFLSGYSGNRLWANAVATASLVGDYLPGTVAGVGDPVMYVVKATDPQGGQAFQDWADAVTMGADFYDVDGNGLYDPNIDMPDLLGDETVWCVYHDGVPAPVRRWNSVEPIGIEVRQTVFALNSKGAIGNIIFLRYRIKYVGLGTPDEPDKLDDVYFGVWADPDIGNDYQQDLVGSDISRNAIYTYKSGPDASYGNNPPAYFATFFSGPIEYIPGETFIDNNSNGEYDEGDEPLDTAYSVRGQRIGKFSYPGARNQPLSSTVEYFNGFQQDLNDPNTHINARNFMLGIKGDGEAVDPCDFAVGEVRGVDCSTIDPRFWFSGDPVSNVGWIGTQPWDVRQMANTGPFTLYKDTEANRNAGRLIEKEIIVAYVVGRGTSNLNSITRAREINDISQQIFDNNFPSPPAPNPTRYETKTGDDFIDLTWVTSDASGSSSYGVNYRAVDTVLDIDRRLQGYYVTAFRTNSTEQSINGVVNAVEVANFSVNNGIEDIYFTAPNGGIDLRRSAAPEETQLDSAIYGDPALGRIRLTIRQDPFTEGPLIKGKEYYFSITQYTLNHTAIVNRETGVYGQPGDYLEIGSAYEEFDLLHPLQSRHSNDTRIIKVVFGEDIYSPALTPNTGVQQSGTSDGEVKYLAVSNDQLTGHEYEVTFIKDQLVAEEHIYTPFWKLTNKITGELLVDSSKIYNFDTTSYAGKVTEGFLVKVKPLVPEYSTNYTYTPEENKWYQPFPDPSLAASQGRGVFYVGWDIPQGTNVTPFGSVNTRSNTISADRLNNVEIRFGQTSKAYRYLNGFIGNPVTRGNSYRYAGGITSTDTVGKGAVGNWNQTEDHANGFVDVPFSAYAVDKNGNEQRLAVGFIERSSSGGQFLGIPDGVWNPDTALLQTREIIIVFDRDYSETPQIEYTGGVFSTTSGDTTVWADIMQIQTARMPLTAQGVTELQRNIFASPWFNALYVIGFQKNPAAPSDFYEPGDIFKVPVSVYPYTSEDRFTFSTRPDGGLTRDEEKTLFDKINVFPNPLYGFNPATSYSNSPADEPFVTFSNLPQEDVTIKIYTLSGTLIRTLTSDDANVRSNPASPFMKWNLLNESGLRAASGLYIAIVSVPNFGEKILKFSIIMPQKQIERF